MPIGRLCRKKERRLEQSLPLLLVAVASISLLIVVHSLNRPSSTMAGNPYFQGAKHYCDNEQYARLGVW